MAKLNTCDICKRVLDEQNPLAAKLFIKYLNGTKSRNDASEYDGHMDVGSCCVDGQHGVRKRFSWQIRVRRQKAPASV